MNIPLLRSFIIYSSPRATDIPPLRGLIARRRYFLSSVTVNFWEGESDCPETLSRTRTVTS